MILANYFLNSEVYSTSFVILLLQGKDCASEIQYPSDNIRVSNE